MRVGIVIPAHNAADTIRDAVRSVQAQTVGEWELVVVDDGSTDGTADCIADILDRRIRIIAQPNAGVSAARNAGIAVLPPVDGVLFLDADDWLAPNALQRLRSALTGDAVAACGPYACVDAEGDRVLSIKRPLAARDSLCALLDRNHFANGGHLLIRRDAIGRAGPFRTDLRFGEDYEYWIRLALLGRFASLAGAPVLFVRRRNEGAYWRAAHDPAAHAGCIDAIFANPMLAARLGAGLPRARRRMEAEAEWIVGRALLARGDADTGLRHLLGSFRDKPGWRRTVLLATLGLRAAIRRRRGPEPKPAPSRIPPAT